MANLIVSVIAIALVAITLIAVAYYGGSAFNNRGEQAQIGTLINEGEQLKGAIDYYRVEHNNQLPAELSELVNERYLQDLPKGAQVQWKYGNGNNHAITMLDAGEANYSKCIKLRQKFNFDAPSSCSSASDATSDNQQCLRVCYDPTSALSTDNKRITVNPRLAFKDPCCINNEDPTDDTDFTLVGDNSDVILP